MMDSFVLSFLILVIPNAIGGLKLSALASITSGGTSSISWTATETTTSSPTSSSSLYRFSHSSVARAAILDRAPLTINSPSNLTACEPAVIDWGGGTPPYFVSVIPGNEPSGSTLATLAVNSTETSATWTVNVTAGDSVAFQVTDSTGSQDFSSAVTIQSGSSSCGGSSFNTSSGSSTSAIHSSIVSSTSASSPASSPTATNASSTSNSASSTSNSSSTSNPTSADQSSIAQRKKNVGAIAGGVIGGVIGALILLAGSVLFIRRRRRGFGGTFTGEKPEAVGRGVGRGNLDLTEGKSISAVGASSNPFDSSTSWQSTPSGPQLIGSAISAVPFAADLGKLENANSGPIYPTQASLPFDPQQPNSGDISDSKSILERARAEQVESIHREMSEHELSRIVASKSSNPITAEITQSSIEERSERRNNGPELSHVADEEEEEEEGELVRELQIMRRLREIRNRRGQGISDSMSEPPEYE